MILNQLRLLRYFKVKKRTHCVLVKSPLNIFVLYGSDMRRARRHLLLKSDFGPRSPRGKDEKAGGRFRK